MDTQNQRRSAVILAAGVGTRMSRLTTMPKCLLPINEKSLLLHHLDHAAALGFSETIIVVGYRHEVIRQHLASVNRLDEVIFVENPDFVTKGNGYSLYLGIQRAAHVAVVFDGDVIYDRLLLEKFLDGGVQDKVLVGPGSIDDLECAKALVDHQYNIVSLIDKSKAVETASSRFLGEAIGILMFTKQGRQRLLECAEWFFSNSANLSLNWEHLINQYVAHSSMRAWYEPSDRWTEIDTPDDYEEAKRKFERVTPI